ncbi:MAG: HAD family hydrolase [Nanoarchaeota archaeon]
MRWYLLDMDNTLVDGEIYGHIYDNVIFRTSQETGLTYREISDIANAAGLKKNRRDRWDTADLTSLLNVSNVYYDELEKAMTKDFVNKNARYVIDTLRKKGKYTGVVSNSRIKTINKFLTYYELWVDLIYSSEHAGCKKDKDQYWLKLSEFINPAQSVMIGDDYYEDVVMPSKHGFNTFHYQNDLLHILELENNFRGLRTA